MDHLLSYAGEKQVRAAPEWDAGTPHGWTRGNKDGTSLRLAADRVLTRPIYHLALAGILPKELPSSSPVRSHPTATMHKAEGQATETEA